MHITDNVSYFNVLPKKAPVFKALFTDEDIFGIDGDAESRKLRNYIRDRLYVSCFIPVIDKKTSCSEMRYANTIDDVYIRNFKSLGNSSYSGECLMHKPEYFKLLRPSSVSTIIDLRCKEGLKECCDEYNIDYYYYDTSWGYGGQSIFKKDEDLLAAKAKELTHYGVTKKEFDESIEKYKSQIQEERTQYVRKLADLIGVVNYGHFYMSCEYGEYRTVNCLALVSIFNPEWHGEKIHPHSAYVNKFKTMYENLTPEHKKILKIDEKYDEYLKRYIAKLSEND